jgi:serine/threonine-protein kinase
LLPASEDEVQAAAALAERAVAAKATTDQWVYPYFLFAQGLAEYRQGRFDSAISIMRGHAGTVMGPAPRLVVAMAEYRKGQKEEARKTLAAAISSFDWGGAQVGGLDHWIWHVLRREAESMILPIIPSFLEGRYQPQDNVERLALLGICQFRNLNLASARLYTEAFAANPKLADDLRVGRRFNAARAAALVGCGAGADGGSLSEAERGRWRKQARAWLRADLSAWAKKLDSRTAADRARVKNTLARWQADPDLAGVREPGALANLSADERKDCLALWEEVDLVLKRARGAR